MPAANTSKTTPKAVSGTSAKKSGTAETKKKAVKVDPYDDPFAPSPSPAKTRKKSASSKSSKSTKPKTPKVQDNPLGLMAVDPYDNPWADPAKQKPARKSPTRVSGVKKQQAAKSAPAKKHEPDPFDEPVVKKKSSGGRNGSGRKKKKGSGYLAFLLSTLIVLCVLFISLQLYNYTKFMQMRNAVDGVNFFAGTTIDGVDISQMTMEGAIEHWEKNIEPQFYSRTVNLDNGMSVTAGELGYTSNYREVIESAWKSQTTGTLADRYAALNRYSASGTGYSVKRSIYDEDALISYAANVAAQTDTPVKEPTITSFDHDALSFTFAEGTPGRIVDQDMLVADMKKALDAGGGNVAVSINTTQPTLTVADMQGMYGLRAYAVTNASSSSSNRLTNIRLALASINGTLLKPGETFSFNKVVGKRTSDRGYKVATAYNAGEVTEELGGGICQVSTTLFNAVVKSDLKVTERHNHSIPVSYVDKGKDAAVSWGAQDLQFTNNSSEPVYIVAYMDSEKRVRIGIFGRLLEDGKYITVESKITYSKEFETVYQLNSFLLPGAQAELQSGRNTYEAMAYKCTWTADGELISREELCKSNYRGRDQIIEYGP